jgi:hypothetical protein
VQQVVLGPPRERRLVGLQVGRNLFVEINLGDAVELPFRLVATLLQAVGDRGDREGGSAKEEQRAGDRVIGAQANDTSAETEKGVVVSVPHRPHDRRRRTRRRG